MSKLTPITRLGTTAVDTSLDERDADANSQANDMAIELAAVKKKSVTGAVGYLLRSLFLTFISMGAAFVIAAYLSPADYGIYGLVTQIVGLLQFVSDIGLGPVLIQQQQEPTNLMYRTVFWTQQGLAWLIFILAMAIVGSGVFTNQLGAAGAGVLLALAISFPLASLKVVSALRLERKLDFNRLIIPTLVENIVYNVLLVGLVVMNWGLHAYTIAIVARAVVGAVVMWMIEPWPIGWGFDKQVWRQVVGVGIKFQASDLLAKVKDQFYYLALGLFLPIEQFGYISWAKGWSQLPYQLTVQNVIAVTFPAYARLQNNKLALKKAIEKTVFFVSVATFPLLMGAIIFIMPLVKLVPDYQKWQPALLTFVLFSFSLAWAAISTPLTNTLNAMGRINDTLKLMIMWTSLTWLLTPVLLYLFGFNGVAIAAAIISVTSVAPIWLVKKQIDVAIWQQVWPPLLATIAMGGVGWLGQPWWQINWQWFMLGMVTVGISYLFVLLLAAGGKLLNEVQKIWITARA